MEEKLLTNSVHSVERMPFSVDYRLNLKEIINIGNYHDVDLNINEKNFPVLRDREVDTARFIGRLFTFNRLSSTEEAVEHMMARNFEPAPLRETLLLDMTHQKLLKRFLIIGLGSSWKRCGDLVVPGLTVNVLNRRIVKLYSQKGIWPSTTNFLGIQRIHG